MAEKERVIADGADIDRFIDSVAEQAAALCPEPSQLAYVGIRSRGEHLAQRMRDRTSARTGGGQVPLGILDITLYRDDLDDAGAQPVVRKTSLPFNVTGRILILVDDVLNTGRTTRAALDQIIDFGRPRAIKLAVLVDRGNREFPIQGDFVGLSVQAGPGQDVQVRLREVDGRDEVVLIG